MKKNKRPTRDDLIHSWLDHPYFHMRSTEEEVMEGLHNLIRDLNLDHFAFFLVRVSHDRTPVLRPPSTLTSYPREWINPYLRRHYYLADPVFHEVRWSNRPFYWGSEQFLKPFSTRQKKVLEDAGKHGLRYGLAVPVHGCMGSIGVFNLVDEDPEWLRRSTQGHHRRLYAVALDLHELLLHRVLEIVQKEEMAQGKGNSYVLTYRERECLLWTMEGYSAKDVGRVLGLKGASVERYLSNLNTKMGCGNKFASAIRGYRNGTLLGGAGFPDHIRRRKTKFPPLPPKRRIAGPAMGNTLEWQERRKKIREQEKKLRQKALEKEKEMKRQNGKGKKNGKGE